MWYKLVELNPFVTKICIINVFLFGGAELLAVEQSVDTLSWMHFGVFTCVGWHGIYYLVAVYIYGSYRRI